MEKVTKFFGNLLSIVTGYGFYGLGLVGGAIAAFILGFGFIGWGLLGAFIGKNMQAIKEVL